MRFIRPLKKQDAPRPKPIELTAGQIEQVTGAHGAGAGKVTFNPFQITRKIDRASLNLF